MNSKKTFATTALIPISPSLLAKAFCEMNGDEMAAFFNLIGHESNEWKAPFCFQLQYVVDSPYLGKEGRRIMRAIGDYHDANSSGE